MNWDCWKSMLLNKRADFDRNTIMVLIHFLQGPSVEASRGAARCLPDVSRRVEFQT